MNIAFIFRSPIIPYIGGIQRVTDILTREFQKLGHNVVYISLLKNKRDYKEFSAKQEYLIGDKDSDNNYVEKYLNILKENKIDICVFQMFTKEIFLLLQITPSHIRKISVHHTVPYSHVGKERRIKRNLHSKNILINVFKYLVLVFPCIGRYKNIKEETAFFRRVATFSDKIVFLTNDSCERVAKYLPEYNIEKFTAINNPKVSTSPGDISLNKENLIIILARLEEVPKNIRDFIDMWSILSIKNPDWKTLIIGDGSDRKYLENYAKKKGVKNLEFTGYVANVSDFYERARIVCTTSIFEGWGMTLVEGMSHGCIPCAYGSYSAVFDIIDDGINGMITTPFSPENMAERIQEVIDNKDLAEKLSKGALKKVQDFSVDRIAQKWIDLFNELINAD